MLPYNFIMCFIELFCIIMFLNNVAGYDKTDLLLITVASNQTDGFKRFMASADKFGYQVKVLGLDSSWKGGDMNKPGGGYKVNLVKKELASLVKEADSPPILMFTDSYDVILTEGPLSVVNKFSAFDANIVFSAEPYCWPDQSLADKYPPTESPYKYLNSGGYIGFTKNLYKFMKDKHIENWADDQLFFTKFYLDRSVRESNRIRLDTHATIFQNLHGALEDVVLESDSDRVYLVNSRLGGRASVIHGNGFSKVQLNSLGNYIGGAWHPSLGCSNCRSAAVHQELPSNLPVIVLAVFIPYKTPFLMEFLDKIAKLEYPKNKMHLFLYNNEDYHKGLTGEFISNFGHQYLGIKQIKPEDEISEKQARNFAVELCKKRKCGYLFVVDSIAHLDSPSVLTSLMKNEKGVVGPVLARPFKAWSNFWGALNADGFYARSFDYMDIINNNKRGVWNVPYLTYCYLVNATLLDHLSEAYHSDHLDPDMAFCQTLRQQNVFMFVDNLEDFGHLVDHDSFNTHWQHPDFYQLMSNQHDWERRYISSDYLSNFDKNNTPSQPCPDVYWFPLVSPRFCSDLIDIMENFGRWSTGSNHDERLNGGYENVPTRDIHMNQVGLERMWLEFLRLYVRPLQEHIFTGYYHDPPKSLMNFVVRYKPDEQPFLRPHHDSSTYTINIALNRPKIDYQGGGCRFIRYNCSVVDTRLGWVLMHPGRLTHYHEGLPVTEGVRYIMISFVDP